jgi:hypothetical protein
VERTVAVAIDDFVLGLLEDASAAGGTTPGVLLMRAIRYYLAERDSRRPGWPCSRLDEEGETVETTSIELEVDGKAWEAFSLEAERQRVSTDQLLQHGALYYLADRDSGRLTETILEDLEKQKLQGR